MSPASMDNDVPVAAQAESLPQLAFLLNTPVAPETTCTWGRIPHSWESAQEEVKG